MKRNTLLSFIIIEEYFTSLYLISNIYWSPTSKSHFSSTCNMSFTNDFFFIINFTFFGGNSFDKTYIIFLWVSAKKAKCERSVLGKLCMYCEHYIKCTTWDANFDIYRWIIPNWQFTKTILPLYHRNCVSLFSSWRSWDCNIFKNRNTCMIVNKTTFYDSLSIKYKWTLIWQFRRQLPTDQIMWTSATTHHFSSSTMKKNQISYKSIWKIFEEMWNNSNEETSNLFYAKNNNIHV